jgi:hypothetical protein
MKAYAPYRDQVLDVEVKDGSCFHNNQPLYAVPLDDTVNTSPNKSLTPEGFQFVWDSVSLNHLKTCPYKYYLSTIQGWTFKIKPVKMAFGIAFHTLMQTFHTLLAAGIDRDTAIHRTVRLAGLLGDYIPEGSTAHTKATLTRAFVWYVHHFEDDPARILQLPDGNAAVELDTRFPFVEVHGVQTYIVVHLDTLVEFHGGVYFMDYKSTAAQLNKNFFEKFVQDNQMALYHLAASVTLDAPIAGGIIDAVQIGVNYARFQRHLLDRTPAKNQDFIDDLEKWLNLAAIYAENDYYPQNETACGQYGGCHFRDVCKHSRREHEMYLRTSFRKSTWDPSKRRI